MIVEIESYKILLGSRNESNNNVMYSNNLYKRCIVTIIITINCNSTKFLMLAPRLKRYKSIYYFLRFIHHIISCRLYNNNLNFCCSSESISAISLLIKYYNRKSIRMEEKSMKMF